MITRRSVSISLGAALASLTVQAQEQPASAEPIQSTIDRFLAAANSSGATVDLFTHPRGHHGFDILDADDRSREIIRLTLAAVKDSLGVGASRIS